MGRGLNCPEGSAIFLKLKHLNIYLRLAGDNIFNIRLIIPSTKVSSKGLLDLKSRQFHLNVALSISLHRQVVPIQRKGSYI